MLKKTFRFCGDTYTVEENCQPEPPDKEAYICRNTKGDNLYFSRTEIRDSIVALVPPPNC